MFVASIQKHLSSYSTRRYCKSVHCDINKLLKDYYKNYSQVFVDDSSKYQLGRRKAAKLRQSAVLVPIIKLSALGTLNEGNLWILFTLRSSHMRSHSNEISFPGGRLEDNETFQQAALRECYEEIGIVINPSNIIAELSQISHTRGSDSIVPIVCVVNQTDLQKILPNAEVDKVILIPVKQLITNIRYTTFRQKENQLRYRLPVFLISKYWDDVNSLEGESRNFEHRVWGLTALILHRTFLNLSTKTNAQF